MSLDLFDVVMIEQRLKRYGHIVDAHGWGRFGEVFTADLGHARVR